MIHINFQRNQTTDSPGNGENTMKQQADVQYNKEVIERLKGFRLKLDSFYLTAKEFVPSRYISLTITSLQSARQFTGLVLGERKAKYPYEEGSNPNSEKIDARADSGAVIPELIDKNASEVIKLKRFRLALEELIIDILVYIDLYPYQSIKEFVSQNTLLAQTMQAKMWLGERLGEIGDKIKELDKKEQDIKDEKADLTGPETENSVEPK